MQIWTSEALLDEIRKASTKTADGTVKTSMLPSHILKRIRQTFGSWQAACEIAGVKCIDRKVIMKNCKRNMQRQSEIDLQGGVDIRAIESICWDCAKSGGVVKGAQCSWDKELKMVQGAVYMLTERKNQEDGVKVLQCPEFERWEKGKDGESQGRTAGGVTNEIPKH